MEIAQANEFFGFDQGSNRSNKAIVPILVHA
jgi:hypothetical protein